MSLESLPPGLPEKNDYPRKFSVLLFMFLCRFSAVSFVGSAFQFVAPARKGSQLEREGRQLTLDAKI
jgi:hypothetical protein